VIYKVKLKNSDQTVYLDDYVYEWLSNDPLYVEIRLLDNLRLHSSGCAVFQKLWRRSDGSSKIETIYLHRLLADRYLSHQKTDTIAFAGTKSGEKLDCRVENLLFRSRSMAGRQRKSKGQSGYFGVYKEHKKYRAVINIDGKPHHIGMFKTPEEAALAYNKAAKESFGEEAKINKFGQSQPRDNT
jgi:hypothetical protein